MNVFLSILPILLLFVLMLGIKMAGHKSAFITLVATLLCLQRLHSDSLPRVTRSSVSFGPSSRVY